jgi:glycosyltransferase involved in cell wall biosynthesis
MVTVVVLVKNEAKQLVELLPQLTWADKTLVIDDESSDDSCSVARSLGATCISHPLDGDFSAQRNFALSLIPYGWVLFLDADERLSKTAERAIVSLASSTDERDQQHGYQLLRQDIFYGKRLQHGEAGSLYLTRFAHVSAGMWRGAVHEVWDIAQLKHLPGLITHYSHSSANQLFASVSGYAWTRSRELRQQGVLWSLFQQLVYPVAKLAKAFIVDRVFLDGWQGILMAIAMSWHSWLVRWHLWTMDWHHRSWKLVVARYLMVMPWILLPFGQLLRAETAGHAWYGFELFMGLAIVWSMLCGLVSKKSVKAFPELWLLVFWMGCSFVISLVTTVQFGGGLYVLRFLLYVLYLHVFIDALKHWLFVAVDGLIHYEMAGLLVGGVGQYLIMPDMRWLRWFGWDDHYYRMIGLLFDPNYLAILILLFMVFAFFTFTHWKRMAVLSILSAALVATYSRTVWLLTASLGLLVCVYRRSVRVILVGVFGCILLWLLLPKPGGEGVNVLRSFSITTRFGSWSKAISVWKQSPVIGVGYNRYGEYSNSTNQLGIPYHPSSPDSSWLQVLSTMGIVGLGIFMWMWLVWWRRYTNPMIRVSLVCIGLHACTNNTFFYPWILLWMWLLFAYDRQVRH